MYTIEDLDKTEYVTLIWLNCHGYDAGILDFFSENDDGTASCRPIEEHEAWTIKEAIEDDPDAFLACNGSRSLSSKLFTFLDSIV
jgi:hypothetical protein